MFDLVPWDRQNAISAPCGYLLFVNVYDDKRLIALDRFKTCLWIMAAGMYLRLR